MIKHTASRSGTAGKPLCALLSYIIYYLNYKRAKQRRTALTMTDSE